MCLQVEKRDGSGSKGSSHQQRIERAVLGDVWSTCVLSWFANEADVSFGDRCVVLGADLSKVGFFDDALGLEVLFVEGKKGLEKNAHGSVIAAVAVEVDIFLLHISNSLFTCLRV